MFLITPDQKMLKSPGDLKLYIAKSGAVIDSNIVNFALPKKTAKVDKAIQNLQPKTPTKETTSMTTAFPNVTKEMKRLGHIDDKGKKKAGTEVIFPKSSRRETKVPLKYRDFSPERKKEVEKKKEKKKEKKVEENLDDDINVEDDFDDVDYEEVTSPMKTDLTTIGVGTFSIDKDSVMRGKDPFTHSIENAVIDFSSKLHRIFRGHH